MRKGRNLQRAEAAQARNWIDDFLREYPRLITDLAAKFEMPKKTLAVFVNCPTRDSYGFTLNSCRNVADAIRDFTLKRDTHGATKIRQLLASRNLLVPPTAAVQQSQQTSPPLETAVDFMREAVRCTTGNLSHCAIWLAQTAFAVAYKAGGIEGAFNLLPRVLYIALRTATDQAFQHLIDNIVIPVLDSEPKPWLCSDKAKIEARAELFCGLNESGDSDAIREDFWKTWKTLEVRGDVDPWIKPQVARGLAHNVGWSAAGDAIEQAQMLVCEAGRRNNAFQEQVSGVNTRTEVCLTHGRLSLARDACEDIHRRIRECFDETGALKPETGITLLHARGGLLYCTTTACLKTPGWYTKDELRYDIDLLRKSSGCGPFTQRISHRQNPDLIDRLPFDLRKLAAQFEKPRIPGSLSIAIRRLLNKLPR